MLTILALSLGCGNCGSRFADGYDEGYALGAACQAQPVRETESCTECVFSFQANAYRREQDCFNDGKQGGWRNGTEDAGCFDTGDTGEATAKESRPR